MDFSTIFQLRTKNFWWMDAIFYFAISLLVATIICYGIFLIKNNLLNQDIQNEIVVLSKVGTVDQKMQETSVINYQKKISDFSSLFQNHQFASNVFAFMQTQTLPDIWFKQFSLDEKGSVVQLSGEADSMDALSRQVASLEKNKYVKDLGNISSSLGDSDKIEFNLNITLDSSIFNYLSDMTPILETSDQTSQPQAQQNQTTAPVGAAAPAVSQNSNTSAPASGQQVQQTESSEKLITSFHLLLNPEVIGQIDENNHTITLNVPYGTDVKVLTPIIVSSPGSTVMPASNAPQNFTSPVTYIVSAQDGSVQRYKATVNILPKTVEKTVKLTAGSGLLAGIILVFIIIILIGAAGFFIWKKIHAN